MHSFREVGFMSLSYTKRGYLNSDFRIFHLTDNVSREFDYHYHDFHKITIFIRGKVKYVVEGKSYDLSPYDIVLVNRGELHRIVVSDKETYERIIVYISPSFIEAYQTESSDLSLCFKKAQEEHSSVLRIQSMEKSALLQTTLRLERSFDDSEFAGGLYRQVLFLEFMIQLNRAALKNNLEFLDAPTYNPKVTHLIQYINAHLSEPLDMDTLASELYISKYHMMRLFKTETSSTIGSYINQKRLLTARDLILQGVSVTDACFQSGFKDYSTFSRAYKKEFKVSPRNTLNKI